MRGRRVSCCGARLRDRQLPADRRELEALPAAQRGSLHGVPFGVKDNIDVEGFPTTAACKAFGYSPAASAPVVQQLLEAGGPQIPKLQLRLWCLIAVQTGVGSPKLP